MQAKRASNRLYRQVWKKMAETSRTVDGDQQIYVVMSKASGLVKVGITGNLRARLMQLSRQTGGAIEPLFCFAGNKAVEGSLHHLFAEWRMRGEWFRREGLVDRFIADMRTEPTAEVA